MPRAVPRHHNNGNEEMAKTENNITCAVERGRTGDQVDMTLLPTARMIMVCAVARNPRDSVKTMWRECPCSH